MTRPVTSSNDLPFTQPDPVAPKNRWAQLPIQTDYANRFAESQTGASKIMRVCWIAYPILFSIDAISFVLQKIANAGTCTANFVHRTLFGRVKETPVIPTLETNSSSEAEIETEAVAKNVASPRASDSRISSVPFGAVQDL